MDVDEGHAGGVNFSFSLHEWSRLFNHLPCGLLVVDRRGRITAANSRIVQAFGYPLSELVGKAIWSLMPIRQRRRQKNLLKEFFVSPREQPLGAGTDIWGLTKNGREILLKAGMNVWEVQEKTLAMFLLMPVPPKSHMEESCFQMNFQVVEHSKDHMAILNNHYHYQYVNWVYEQAHGIPRADIIGKSVSEILGKHVFDTVAKYYLDRCLLGERVVYQYGFHFKGKGFRQMEVTYFPLRSFQAGPVDRVLVQSRDLTEKLLKEQTFPLAQEGKTKGGENQVSQTKAARPVRGGSKANITPGWMKLSQLSSQKRTILAYVAQGKTNKEIAALMKLSDKTVRNHLTSIFRKLRIRRRPEAASFFVRSVIDDVT